MDRLQKVFSYRHSTFIIIALALLLLSPSLWVGYFADDYQHHALLSPEQPFPHTKDGSLFGLFSFINGDPARNLLLRDHSLMMWWGNSDLKFAFWRPVSEITHWIDHRLWRNSPALMHAQSLLWYAVLCWLVAQLYRQRSSGNIVAIGAGLLAFALDNAHGFGVSWIASRNAVIAATFGMASLLAYMRWHDSGLRRFQWASLLAMALSLLSAEIGISTAAYLGAFALVLDRHGALRGLLRLAPHMLLTLAWWSLYKYLGFGASNADAYYIDPAHSPLAFLFKVAERLPVMLASQFGLVPAEVYGYATKPMPAYVVLCMVYVSFVLYLFRHTLRAHPSSRFWLLGSLFALFPVLTALPANRNLLFVSIGGAILIGELFNQWRLRLSRNVGFRQKTGSLIVASFIAIHLLISPLLMPVMAYSPILWKQQMQLEATHLPEIDALEDKILLLSGTPLAAALALVPTRYAEGLPLPAQVWTLNTLQPGYTHDPVTLYRTNNEELIAYAPKGFIQGTETTLRAQSQRAFTIGQQIPFTGMTMEVAAINDAGQPTALSLKLTPSQAARIRLLQWHKSNNREESHYSVHTLPELGGTLVLSQQAHPQVAER
ncbi:Hypothetical protein HDN1F_36130 [gamma proteobacterium HdN1]|nr:Hypothetical protein HDN1F_36130 [gamma proteobacterium HdN1]